jgi:hypothetical protein
MIKSFKEFMNEFEIEGEHQEGKPLWNGKDYINEFGGIDLRNMGLNELPCVFPEKWDESFYCSFNQLTSLQGVPKEIGGDFYCSYNKLTSLEGAPEEVRGGFYCSNNQLTSLESAPEEIGGDFNCSFNQLTSLEGAPRKVGRDFDCSYNKIKFTKEDVITATKLKGITYIKC